MSPCDPQHRPLALTSPSRGYSSSALCICQTLAEERASSFPKEGRAVTNDTEKQSGVLALARGNAPRIRSTAISCRKHWSPCCRSTCQYGRAATPFWRPANSWRRQAAVRGINRAELFTDKTRYRTRISYVHISRANEEAMLKWRKIYTRPNFHAVSTHYRCIVFIYAQYNMYRIYT